MEDVCSYLYEKDKDLLKILNIKLFIEKGKDPNPGHKPFFISVLMNEKEQLIVLKSWLEFIVSNQIPEDDRIFKVKNLYIIITFVMSELTEQMRNKCNVRGEIMMKIKDLIDKLVEVLSETIKKDRTVELLKK